MTSAVPRAALWDLCKRVVIRDEQLKEESPAAVHERLKVIEKLQPLYEPRRYKILWGGRYGIKSWSVARALLDIGIQRKVRIMCARETMRSLAESVHKLLSEQIILCRLQRYYEVQKSAIRGSNGTEFFYSSLRQTRQNIESVRSTEGVDIVWIEEAQSVSETSWQTLVPTIRKEGSEIWATWNPIFEDDPTYVRFIRNPPPDAFIVRLSWRDNLWITEVMRREIDHLRATNPAEYDHVYEGAPRSTIQGAIYAEEIHKAEVERRITRVPYDPTHPVDTFWDLGYGDGVSIWFAQPVAFEYRVIDYYENAEKPIDFYLKILQSKEYTYGTCVLPWDGGAKQLGTGRSIEELIRAKGFKARVMPQISVADGINAVRTIFPQCYFDAEKCRDGLAMLRRYQWGPPSASGVARRTPLHDDASHAADALRTMGVSIKPPKTKQTTGQTNVRDPWRGGGGGDRSQGWMAG